MCIKSIFLREMLKYYREYLWNGYLYYYLLQFRSVTFITHFFVTLQNWIILNDPLYMISNKIWLKWMKLSEIKKSIYLCLFAYSGMFLLCLPSACVLCTNVARFSELSIGYCAFGVYTQWLYYNIQWQTAMNYLSNYVVFLNVN